MTVENLLPGPNSILLLPFGDPRNPAKLHRVKPYSIAHVGSDPEVVLSVLSAMPAAHAGRFSEGEQGVSSRAVSPTDAG